MIRELRLHSRRSKSTVEVDSPLLDCRLLNLSTSGLAIETNVGLRLGVPYPFRLRDGEQLLNIEAEVRWCRLVRNETVDGESRPVFHAGAAFVDWQAPEAEEQASAIEQQIDDTLEHWLAQSRVPDQGSAERTIIHRPPHRRLDR